ncbi:hypothetical protein H4582DRAFT_1069752 [Lactarius indigo]|nr:hypothetical protein H4582DRAFT_1069752 [Lactarius indigo]
MRYTVLGSSAHQTAIETPSIPTAPLDLVTAHEIQGSIGISYPGTFGIHSSSYLNGLNLSSGCKFPFRTSRTVALLRALRRFIDTVSRPSSQQYSPHKSSIVSGLSRDWILQYIFFRRISFVAASSRCSLAYLVHSWLLYSILVLLQRVRVARRLDCTKKATPLIPLRQFRKMLRIFHHSCRRRCQ